MSRVVALFVLLVCLAAGGCADSHDKNSDNRFDGFYGGINAGGGMSR